MRPYCDKLLGNRPGRGERVKSDGIEVPTFRFAVSPVVSDFVLFSSVRGRRRLVCGTGEDVEGVGAADGYVQS